MPLLGAVKEFTKEEIDGDSPLSRAARALQREKSAIGNPFESVARSAKSVVTGDANQRPQASYRESQRYEPESWKPNDPVSGLLNVGNKAGALLAYPYEAGARALGVRPEKRFEPVELPRLDPSVAQQLLPPLYGSATGGDHWDESFTEMLQTQDGFERAKSWKAMVEYDPAYQARASELESRFGGRNEAFWIQAIGEYKEARKKDATLNTTQLAANTGVELALTAGPVGLTARAIRAAGKEAGVKIPLRKAIQAGVTEEVMALPRIADAVVTKGGKSLLRNPRVLGVPVAMGTVGAAVEDDPVEGFAKWATAGAAVSAASGARSLWRGAKGKSPTALDMVGAHFRMLEDAVPGPKLKPMDVGWTPGKVRPTIGNVSEAYGITPKIGMGAGTTAAMGALYAGMLDASPESILAGAAIGGGARILGARYPGQTVGGLVGGLTGATVNEDDPMMGALLGTGLGIAGGSQLKRVPEGMRWAIFTEGDVTQDMRGWARHTVGNLAPEADLRRIPILAELLFPQLDEADQLFDAARIRMKEDFADAVGAARLNDERFMDEVYTAMEGMGKGGELRAPLTVSEDVLEAVRKSRRAMDRWFDDMVEKGLLTAEDYEDLYVPHMLDRKAFGKMAADKGITVDGARGVDNGLKKVFRAIENDSVEGYDNARDFFVMNPNKFMENLLDGGLGLNRAEAVKLLGGEKRLKQLQSIVELSDEVVISPTSTISIMRAGGTRGQRAGMWGGQIKDDWIPEQLRADFDIVRKDTNIPVVRHLPTVIDRYTERMARRMYYEPLLREWNDPDQIRLARILGVPEDQVEKMSPKLQELHNKLADGDLDQISSIARRLVNSRLGVPSELDAVVSDLLLTIMKDPQSARLASRLALDLKYSGALGFNVAAAGRNLFQSLITATALGPEHLAMGIREVSRREKYWTELAAKKGALVDPVQEAFDVAKISNRGTTGRMWNAYVESAFSLFHAADRKNRTWAFAGGYRRAMLEHDKLQRLGTTDAVLKSMRDAFEPFRPADRLKLAKLALEGSADEFASAYGKAVSDTTHWVYGKRGSPLMTRNMVGANLGIFTTWPLNYISLMYEWASNGRIGPIMDMALGAAILERAGEEVGLGRVTGFTSDTTGPAKAIPAGPMPTDITPPSIKGLGEAGYLAGQVGRAAVGADADVEAWRVRNLTLGARPALRWWDALQSADDDPERSIRRLTGASTPPED